MKCTCGKEIEHGTNGTEYGLAPWEDSGEGFAICYDCENKLEMQAEVAQMRENISACQRSGRFDLI